jgi:hypothetical protein
MLSMNKSVSLPYLEAVEIFGLRARQKQGPGQEDQLLIWRGLEKCHALDPVPSHEVATHVSLPLGYMSRDIKRLARGMFNIEQIGLALGSGGTAGKLP